MSNRHEWLKDPITNSRLKEIYADADYYWYLKSPEFVRGFLEPLAAIINEGLPQTPQASCLDVGCGEGQLAPLIQGRYIGFDASVDAIAKAALMYGSDPYKDFLVSRLDDFPSFNPYTILRGKQPQLDVVVFGNIFHCLVNEACFVRLIESYAEAVGARFFIVYDLEIFDSSTIDAHFKRIAEYHNTVDLPQLEEVKCHRKILTYQVP